MDRQICNFPTVTLPFTLSLSTSLFLIRERDVNTPSRHSTLCRSYAAYIHIYNTRMRAARAFTFEITLYVDLCYELYTMRIYQPSSGARMHPQLLNSTRISKAQLDSTLSLSRWLAGVFYHISSHRPFQHQAPVIIRALARARVPSFANLTYRCEMYYVYNAKHQPLYLSVNRLFHGWI